MEKFCIQFAKKMSLVKFWSIFCPQTHLVTLGGCKRVYEQRSAWLLSGGCVATDFKSAFYHPVQRYVHISQIKSGTVKFTQDLFEGANNL
jgi:hypothetical protein